MKMNYAAHARSFAAIALLATGLLVLAQSAMAIVTGHEAPPPASPTVQHSVVQSGNQRCTQITPPGTPNVGPAPGPDWICVQTDPGGGGEDPQQFDPANYVENGKLIRASYAVKGLGENLFGDSINLYRGTASAGGVNIFA